MLDHTTALGSTGATTALEARVRLQLEAYGEAPASVEPAGRFTLTAPGYVVVRSTRRETMIGYHSDVPIAPGAVEAILARYLSHLWRGGFTARRSILQLAIVVTDIGIPILDPGSTTLEPITTPDLEAYRRRMIYNRARYWRQTIADHARRGEHITTEGRQDIARHMRAVVEAPLDQINIWRQKGIEE